MPELVELSAAGILAVLILQTILPHLRSRKNGKDHTGGLSARWSKDCQLCLEMTRKSYDMTVDLHRWHQPDSDGEQTWKNKRMLELMESLTNAVANQSRILERLLPVMERLEKKL